MTSNKTNEKIFENNCENCGHIVSYADDSTFLFSSNSRYLNQEILTNKLQNITDFLQSNVLSINPTKTTIMEIMLKQKRGKIKGIPPSLVVPKPDGTPKLIQVVKSTVLLGGTVQNSTSWQEHLDTGEEALLPKLRRKLGALKFLSRNLSMRSRRLLANSFILSRLTYLLPIWGGTEEKYHRKVQAVLNNTARFVVRAGKREKTETLMERCGWFSVRELTVLHSLLMMWRTIHMSIPRHIADRLNIEEDLTVSTAPHRLQNTMKSYRWKTIVWWNSLPSFVRETQEIKLFKKRVKTWILERRNEDNG